MDALSFGVPPSRAAVPSPLGPRPPYKFTPPYPTSRLGPLPSDTPASVPRNYHFFTSSTPPGPSSFQTPVTTHTGPASVAANSPNWRAPTGTPTPSGHTGGGAYGGGGGGEGDGGGGSTPVGGGGGENTSAGGTNKSKGKRQVTQNSVLQSAATNPVRTAEVAPAPSARPKKKRKLGEQSSLADHVVGLIPESDIYNQLLELEKRLDATLARKKLEIQEALRCPPRVAHTLRVRVTSGLNSELETLALRPPNSSASDADGQSSDKPSERVAWTMRIEGWLVNEGAAEGRPNANAKSGKGMETVENRAAELAAGQPKSEPHSQHQDHNQQQQQQQQQQGGKHSKGRASPRFTDFIRKMTVELDSLVFPETPVITWEAAHATSSSPGSSDGFAIHRTCQLASARDFTANLLFELQPVPERFALSVQLSALLGLRVETRPRILAALWQYIKAKKLQAATDPTMIECDSALEAFFLEKKVKMSSLSSRLQSHLTRPSPLRFSHQVHLTGALPGTSQISCYDIAVDGPPPLQAEMADFLSGLEKNADIDALDDEIAAHVAAINERRKRRGFYLGFSESPVAFIHKLMASQFRDLREATGEGRRRDAVKERYSSFYQQPWVEDAVLRYLTRRPGGGGE
eukprot:TRINITY_DN264_c3_g1_i1.p1 TRINITY_DN264_c3_g1~~TRINITY_DN264_c3_g1_i1.p1  ORF type:complete len:632 (-),score=122.56 TRINITY_DN264_c3_g1_i1:1026-2921(-)